MFQVAFGAVKAAATNPFVQQAAVGVAKKVAIDVTVSVAATAAIRTVLDGVSRALNNSGVAKPVPMNRKERNTQRVSSVMYYGKRFGINVKNVVLSGDMLYLIATSALNRSANLFLKGSYQYRILHGADIVLNIGYVCSKIAQALRPLNSWMEENEFESEFASPRKSDQDVVDEIIIDQDLDENGDLSPEEEAGNGEDRDYDEEFRDQEAEDAAAAHDNVIFKEMERNLHHGKRPFNASFEITPVEGEKKETETLVVRIDMNKLVGVRPAQKVAYGRHLNRTLVVRPSDEIEVERVYDLVRTAMGHQEGLLFNRDIQFVLKGFDLMNAERKAAEPVAKAFAASSSK